MEDFGTPLSVSGGSPLVPGNLAASIRTRLQRGDLEGAVRLYEEGRGTLGPLLWSAFDAFTPQERPVLAQLFVAVRDYAYAAGALDKLGRPQEAAPMYERAGEYVLAARCHQAVGNLLGAAAALERAGKPDAALQLYQQAGAPEAMAQCLVRAQRYFDAAVVYRKVGNTHAEVDLLYRVPMASPQRVPAAYRLSELLEQFGHGDQALTLLMETLAAIPSAAMEDVFCQRVVALGEARGRPDLVAAAKASITKVRGGGGYSTTKDSDSAEMRAVLEPHNASAADRLEHRRTRSPELAQATVTPVDPFSGLMVRTGMDGGASDAYRQLKNVPLLSELSFQDLQLLHRMCIPVTYAQNAVVIEQSVRGGGLLVLLEGAVQVINLAAQPPQVLANLGPGETLGEISFIDGAPTSARVVARTPLKGLLVPGDALVEFLATRDAAALRIYRALLKTVAARLRAANLRVA